MSTHPHHRLSPRARAILDAVEREAAAHRLALEAQRTPPFTGGAPSPPLQADEAPPDGGEEPRTVPRPGVQVHQPVAEPGHSGYEGRPRPSAQHVAPPGSPPAPGPGPRPEADDAPRDGARLVAVEMAVSGASRREVGTRLTREFGIEDPTAILNDVFGPGSSETTRMRWG